MGKEREQKRNFSLAFSLVLVAAMFAFLTNPTPTGMQIKGYQTSLPYYEDTTKESSIKQLREEELNIHPGGDAQPRIPRQELYDPQEALSQGPGKICVCPEQEASKVSADNCGSSGEGEGVALTCTQKSCTVEREDPQNPGHFLQALESCQTETGYKCGCAPDFNVQGNWESEDPEGRIQIKVKSPGFTGTIVGSPTYRCTKRADSKCDFAWGKTKNVCESASCTYDCKIASRYAVMGWTPAKPGQGSFTLVRDCVAN